MKIDIDDNIVNIDLNEEEADQIKLLYPGSHHHFKCDDNEIIINKI